MRRKICDMAEDTIERFIKELCEMNLRRGDANDRINAACTAIHTALEILNIKSD